MIVVSLLADVLCDRARLVVTVMCAVERTFGRSIRAIGLLLLLLLLFVSLLSLQTREKVVFLFVFVWRAEGHEGRGGGGGQRRRRDDTTVIGTRAKVRIADRRHLHCTLSIVVAILLRQETHGVLLHLLRACGRPRTRTAPRTVHPPDTAAYTARTCYAAAAAVAAVAVAARCACAAGLLL